jgi:hypothetical protein
MEAAALAAAPAREARGAVVRKGQTECSICRVRFKSDKNGPGEKDPVTANCYHRFHRKCINEWLAEPQSQRSCPVCRDTINVLHVLHSGGRNYKKRQTRRKKGKSRKTRGRRRYSRM